MTAGASHCPTGVDVGAGAGGRCWCGLVGGCVGGVSRQKHELTFYEQKRKMLAKARHRHAKKNNDQQKHEDISEAHRASFLYRYDICMRQ